MSYYVIDGVVIPVEEATTEEVREMQTDLNS